MNIQKHRDVLACIVISNVIERLGVQNKTYLRSRKKQNNGVNWLSAVTDWIVIYENSDFYLF